ncbi:MAG: hypothetical protein ACHP8B_15350 [Terriglobales bacterium]
MSNDPGSAVWRIDFDLDGDGKPEILLSGQSASKHGEAEWDIYKYVSGSQYRFIGSLIFSHRSFQVLQNPPRVEALWFGDAHDRVAGHTVRSADLATYLVAPTGITLNSTTPLQEVDIQTKKTQMDAWRNTVKLRVLLASLDANGKFENPTWHDADTGKPAEGVTSLEEFVVGDSTIADSQPAFYDGKIDRRFEIALSVTRNGGSISGSYQYASQGKPLDLQGTVLPNGQLKIAEYPAPGVVSGEFLVGALPGQTELNGEWHSADGKRSYAVHLQRIDADRYRELLSQWHARRELKSKSAPRMQGSYAAAQSLLEHLVTMLKIQPDADAHRSVPIEVYRMELDVTGDGKPELFLGTTWDTSRNGMLWAVYTPQADGRYRPLGVMTFGYHVFYYSANGSFMCNLVHTGSTEPGLTYYHVGADGIWDITETYSGDSEADLAKMDAWQKQGRPPVYVDTLADLKTSATPQWKDADTGGIASSLGRLDASVTESGDCSAEKFLEDYRNAGCVTLP